MRYRWDNYAGLSRDLYIASHVRDSNLEVFFLSFEIFIYDLRQGSNFYFEYIHIFLKNKYSYVM